MVIRDIGLLHPRAKTAFGSLRNELEDAFKRGKTRTYFKVFETYRTPERQTELLAGGTTKAGMFRSAHQFGLAVDFVPFNDGTWSWDLRHDWDFLRAAARGLGLKNEIAWDRAHVEHPVFEEVQKALRY
jgi:hypothetical protein